MSVYDRLMSNLGRMDEREELPSRGNFIRRAVDDVRSQITPPSNQMATPPVVPQQQINLGGGLGGFSIPQITLDNILANMPQGIFGYQPPAIDPEVETVETGLEDIGVSDDVIADVVDDNTYDLGENGSNVRKRWDDIHATNGVIQTSDRRNKLEITGSNLGLDFVNSLNPVSFKWKETRNRNSWEIQNLTSGSRTHYGLIAQDLSSSLASAGVNTQQFAGITINPATTQVEPDGTIVEDYKPWGIRYNELISPMIKSIQELSEEVSRLKLLISGSGD